MEKHVIHGGASEHCRAGDNSNDKDGVQEDLKEDNEDEKEAEDSKKGGNREKTVSAIGRIIYGYDFEVDHPHNRLSDVSPGRE